MRRIVALAVVLVLVTLASATAFGRSRNIPRGRLRPHPTVALGAHESEFKIRLSRSLVPAGRVVIELRNLGQDPHDLVVARAAGGGVPFDFGISAPGSRRIHSFKLSRGTWLLYCSMPGHAAKGMRATIQVR